MPAAIASPPPPKTAPAPAVVPATPGTPLPSAPEKEPADYMGDISSGLADLDTADETSKRAPERPRDPNTKQFTKPDEKPPKEPSRDEPEPEKAVESPTELEKPVEEPKPSNIRALGKAYDELKKERDTVYKPKLQSLEAKTKEYEQTIEQLKKSAPDLKPVHEKMTALEKENQQLREVVRFADYRKSPEFIEKYEKPYNEAWGKAVSEITQLTMQTEDGTPRKATANDLLALANAPLDQLDDLASNWFPKSSARVVRHVEKIRDLAEAQDKALEEAKKGAGEFQSKRTLEQQQHDSEIAKAYTEVNAALVQKYPKWFAPDEADPQGNELLKKGFDYGATVFDNKPDTINGETRVLTPLERVKRLAVIKAKSANHDRLVARLKAEQKRATELEFKLAEYENSEPPTDDAGQPGQVTNGNWFDPIESELRKMDKR